MGTTFVVRGLSWLSSIGAVLWLRFYLQYLSRTVRKQSIEQKRRIFALKLPQQPPSARPWLPEDRYPNLHVYYNAQEVIRQSRAAVPMVLLLLLLGMVPPSPTGEPSTLGLSIGLLMIALFLINAIRFKTPGFFIGIVALVALVGGTIREAFLEHPPSPTLVFLSLGSTIALGICLLPPLWHALRSVPIISLTSEGIRVNPSGFIEWGNIAEVYTGVWRATPSTEPQDARIIGIVPRNLNAFLTQHPWLTRCRILTELKMGFPPIMIRLVNLSMSPTTLLQEIQRRLEPYTR